MLCAVFNAENQEEVELMPLGMLFTEDPFKSLLPPDESASTVLVYEERLLNALKASEEDSGG